jgi:hypothetical protein
VADFKDLPVEAKDLRKGTYFSTPSLYYPQAKEQPFHFIKHTAETSVCQTPGWK